MIHLTAAQGKYYFSDVVILLSGESTDVDEQALTLGQLEGLKDGYQTGRLIMTTGDYQKLLAALESKTSSGGGGKVGSVNGEIGEVILDASEIDFTSGGSIEEKFGDLSSVAFSGSYLDLSNRPGGTGEPFTVIDWNPYREAVVEKAFLPANGSTSYSNGVITRLLPESLETVLVDVGYPQSPEITVVDGTNGGSTIVTVTPTGSGQLTKTLALRELDSISIAATDLFAHNNNPKGAVLSFFVIQLEDNEDIATMGVQDIVTKTHNININFNNVYLNEYNNYTSMSYNINANGSNAGSDNTNLNGSFSIANFKIEDNRFKMGGGLADISLTEVGFSPTKRYAALFLVQVDVASFDVSTPFHIEVSRTKEAPELSNVLPDNAEIIVKADSELLFAFEDRVTNDYFSLSLVSSQNDFTYANPQVGQISLDPADYTDSNGNVTFKIVNKTKFQIKNYTDNVFIDAYTSIQPFPLVYVMTMSDTYGNTSKNTWNFTVNTWSKVEVLNGILPGNSIDGSTLKVTHSGKFNDVNLVVGDIVNPYDNKTKIIIHRNGQEVSNDVNTAGALPVSGNAVKAYTPSAASLAGETLYDNGGRLDIKLSNATGNLLQTTGSGLSASLPTVLMTYALRETVYNSNYESSVQLGLGIRNIFTINYPGGSVYTYFTSLTDYDYNNSNTAIAKTITIIIVNAASITWPSEIIWADGTPPTIEPNKYLVVNGIHVKSGMEETTSGKVLCSYSYYNR